MDQNFLYYGFASILCIDQRENSKTPRIKQVVLISFSYIYFIKKIIINLRNQPSYLRFPLNVRQNAVAEAALLGDQSLRSPQMFARLANHHLQL